MNGPVPFEDSFLPSNPQGVPVPFTGEPIEVPTPVNPYDEAEKEAFKTLSSAIESSGAPKYEPPPPFMLPKIPGWVLPLLAIIGAADPTKEVVPAAVQGFMQGGRMASQNEATRRQQAVEAARESGQINLEKAKVGYQRAAGQKAAHAKALSDEENRMLRMEIETLKQQGYTERKATEIAFKMLELQTVKQPLAAATVGVKGAQQGKLEAQTADINETRPARIAKMLAEGRGKDAHAEFEQSRTAFQNIVNAHADDMQKVKIKVYNSQVSKNLAQANNALANAAKTKAISSGKGMTDAQYRYFDKNVRQAQEAVDELTSSEKYLMEMEAHWKAQIGSQDPATAQAAQLALGEIQGQKAYLAEKLARARRALQDVQQLMSPVDPVKNTMTGIREVNKLVGAIGG